MSIFKRRKVASRNLTRTKAGSPIYYGELQALGNAGSVRTVPTPTAVVTGRDGKTYHVPVDKKTGKVPMDALFARFADEYSGRRPGQEKRSVPVDLSKTAKVVHKIPKGGFTPEQLIKTGWWQYPGDSDIEGIDDPKSLYMGPWEGTKGAAREASTKIAVIASPAERDYIRKTLTDNFTASELKAAVDKNGLVIMTGNPGRGNAGVYYVKQRGLDTPKIIIGSDLDPRFKENVITHEFVHHLRASDPKRKGVTRYAMPLREDGYSDDIAWSMMSTAEADTRRNMEESATVAETTVRTRDLALADGYYGRIKGHGPSDAQDLYVKDREILTKGSKRSAPQRGKRAIARIDDRYLDTNISNLQYYKKGKVAGDGYVQADIVKPKSQAKSQPKQTSAPKSNAAKAPKKGSGTKKSPATKKTTSPSTAVKKPGSSSSRKTPSKTTNSKKGGRA